MTDIAPELLEKVQKNFEELTAELREEIKQGVRSYEEAYDYAKRIGEALSRSLGVNITPEILPDGKMYYNIADKVVRPMLHAEHELASAAAVSAQKSANKAAGIGIRPLEAKFDDDRAQGIIDRVSSQPFEEVAWILDEPVKTFSKNVVDQTLEKNVEFQGKSGLHPKIVRRATAGACEWCLAVAGTYEYPDVPDDVYRRHANCDCVVEYLEGGKIQDVHSKIIYKSEAERQAAIQNRINSANRMIKERDRNRVWDNNKAPKYERNPKIDALESSEEIKALFPKTVFRKGFDKLDIEVQKEVAQGLDYMQRLLGDKALPTECNATLTTDDLGKTKVRAGKVNLSKNLNLDNAFTTICHECIHVYDGKRGLISERIIDKAAKNLKLTKKKEYEEQILDILGSKLYIKYREDSLEILAYAFEENLYGTQNILAKEIYGELMKQ